MADIVIEGVTKRFGLVEALQRVDLTVRDGQFTVLLGPSGCGKTTLLRMIAGLEMPTTGRVRIGGVDVTELPPARRDVGMVFQSYALYPHMTVRQNITLGLGLRGLPAKEITRRLEQAVDLVRIGPYLDRKPRALSGGQRQRVALARVIAREPGVALMDEPLSNIDAQLRSVMRAELLRIHRQVGMTTIYVTHDQEEAMSLGDRIVVMNFGKVEQTDTPDEVYSHPRNGFVASFVGSPRMNLLRLDLPPGADRIALDGITAPVPPGLGRLPETVLLGFRGEDIRPGEAAAGEAGVSAVIDVVQNLGAQTEVHLRVPDGQEIILRRPHDEGGWTEGARRALAIPAQHIHLFDAASGEAVGGGR